ncbi:TPA: hypothetical protein DIC20_02950 [Candidatus Dependentiae bacterium]|nr:MAG: hypothetical protein US03_C0009G0045 [candidate division TM6 bacterium GW2011_GWF2_36_131]KKQ02884.1 MAG: hypothetical protein US13_C0009G0076 [candidate division TM6 bacterium GW2011_GWE2_36_25]KKQ19536.1 MAG: hypothetical protein US32_C0008G0037 [candidate division TM6 bacterium GW2011_GWA2_36_9]HBR70249.1 hypothetical protein [Candidatus Dependentiae bacterium]HCU00633.1 hypothetical protein [Candidatus Dependentiae bacterium]
MNKKLIFLLFSLHHFYAMEPEQRGILRRGEIQQTLDDLYDQIERMQERGKAEVAANLLLKKRLGEERMAHAKAQLENARLQRAVGEKERRTEKILSRLRTAGVAAGFAGLFYFLEKLLIR